MNPQLYDQLIFNKAGKNIQWKKECFFNKCLGKLHSNMQKKKKKKNETGPLSDTLHQNKFKMDQRPQRETGNG